MTTNTRRVRPIECTCANPKRIVFTGSDNITYVWDRDNTSELDIRLSATDLQAAVKLEPEHVNGNSCDDNWYMVVLADCAFPMFFLVRADSEQDALDWFATECENLCKIDDADLKDYGDDYTVNDNGTPVDLEAVRFTQLTIRRVEC